MNYHMKIIVRSSPCQYFKNPNFFLKLFVEQQECIKLNTPNPENEGWNEEWKPLRQMPRLSSEFFEWKIDRTRHHFHHHRENHIYHILFLHQI